MKLNNLFFLSVVLLPLISVAQQTDPWDSQNLQNKDYVSSQITLDKLIEELHNEFALTCKVAAVPEPSLYIRSMERLKEASAYLRIHPKDKRKLAVEQQCKLIAQAALLQLNAHRTNARVVELLQQNVFVFRQLDSLHESINKIEKSRASKLMADLEEERLKAKKLREEADRKFSELQSALIQVRKDARGTIISMSDILFDIGKATLKPDLKTNLAKIAGILMVIKDAKVIIEGHTDNVGTEEYNQRLSEQRAENVKNFLVEQGVEPSRLTAVGYGFRNPIADNSTAEGRQKNRRVDLVVQDPTSLQ